MEISRLFEQLTTLGATDRGNTGKPCYMIYVCYPVAGLLNSSCKTDWILVNLLVEAGHWWAAAS